MLNTQKHFVPCLLFAVLLSAANSKAQTNVVNSDQVIIGSLGVGIDADNISGSFGFDTVILQENNLRMAFIDSSGTSSFPSNDWRIIINDTANGGENYFAIEDSTAANIPFRVEAGAREDALVAASNGRIGMGTKNPITLLHLKNGNSPALRLEQDESDGFTSQAWDVAGNETNFFIRDSTNESVIPFKIKPGQPNNQLVIGNAGISFFRNDPISGAKFHVNTTPNDVVLIGQSLATTNSAMLQVEGPAYFQGDVEIGSSRELKENIEPLELTLAQETLRALQPVHFNYKQNSEGKLGFIAEDVPDAVASDSRKSLSPMDFIAVLTRVLKDQQAEIHNLKERLEQIESQPVPQR